MTWPLPANARCPPHMQAHGCQRHTRLRMVDRRGITTGTTRTVCCCELHTRSTSSWWLGGGVDLVGVSVCGSISLFPFFYSSIHVFAASSILIHPLPHPGISAAKPFRRGGRWPCPTQASGSSDTHEQTAPYQSIEMRCKSDTKMRCTSRVL